MHRNRAQRVTFRMYCQSLVFALLSLTLAKSRWMFLMCLKWDLSVMLVSRISDAINKPIAKCRSSSVVLSLIGRDTQSLSICLPNTLVVLSNKPVELAPLAGYSHTKT